eukprot:15721351-Heterocapsa_arctica.AAC.1
MKLLPKTELSLKGFRCPCPEQSRDPTNSEATCLVSQALLSDSDPSIIWHRQCYVELRHVRPSCRPDECP